jgi:hypothetical protein
MQREFFMRWRQPGPMLWSQISAIFANFQQNKWRFSQKPIVWSSVSKKPAVVWVKNTNFSRKYFLNYKICPWIRRLKEKWPLLLGCHSSWILFVESPTKKWKTFLMFQRICSVILKVTAELHHWNTAQCRNSHFRMPKCRKNSENVEFMYLTPPDSPTDCSQICTYVGR